MVLYIILVLVFGGERVCMSCVEPFLKLLSISHSVSCLVVVCAQTLSHWDDTI
jgi:hypothetical protein